MLFGNEITKIKLNSQIFRRLFISTATKVYTRKEKLLAACIINGNNGMKQYNKNAST